MQVFFPMCWDGVNLDSPDHRSHMAYPTRYNSGDCPSSHPVRLAGVFYEAFYSVDQFPHGQGTQPFVLASGDPTGYGFHGDFVNGWDTDVMAAAIANDTCSVENTNYGNNPEKCLPLKPFVKARNDDSCELAVPVPLTENIGMVETIDRLPGCNPITYSNAAPCTDGAAPSTMNNAVLANASTVAPNYRQVWGVGWASQGRTIRNAEHLILPTNQVISYTVKRNKMLRIKSNTVNESKYVPFKSVSVDTKIRSFCADVTITQLFQNDEQQPIEAVYCCPIEENAAIYSFLAKVDDREIRAHLKEKKQAQQEYSQALQQGHGAYLVEQGEQSQDMFLINVGALLPRICQI
ncbi:unnamed protein product [Didymodactylos carnosus]|uniref:VIT domain-containing protein n=1 Tax=Didymodactylos carnosus TaxID=1234261 RepID=A0A815CVL3_9BILA|nr:unnamed protein product [Didymodactylos carnosus]CAF4101880.1 unnamed protein product [Didymodactylos carnosus]